MLKQLFLMHLFGITYKYLLVSFIFFFTQYSLYAQKNTFNEDDIIRLDSLIAQNDLNSANLFANELRKSSKYENDDFKFVLDLKIAEILLGSDKKEEAVSLLLQNLAEIENQKKTEFYVKYTIFLGKLFEKERNFDKGLLYLNLGLQESINLKDTLKILSIYNDIGRTYYVSESLDSAKYYFSKVIGYSNFTEEAGQNIIANAYNNLGVIASDEEDFEKAESFGQKVLELRRVQNDPIKIAIALINLSAVYYQKENYLSANKNYMEAYSMVRNSNEDIGVKVRQSALFNLAYSNEMLGSYQEGYKYLEMATDLRDSLTKANISQSISESEARYNFEKQARLAEEEKQKRENAQLRFYGAAFAFLSFLVLSYIFYRNYRLKQQNKLEQIENESQTKIINATVDAKEKERKAIAETLHDSVSALLSSANLHLQATKAQLKKEAPQEITKAQAIVNEASVKIRDLSHELISSVLLKFGLAFAVHDMCQKYSNSEITLHSDDDGIKRYDPDFEIKIHNIVEELVNNILKHSKASNATIMLAHRNNDMLSVRVSDDGIGFNPKTVRGKDGLGLSHIEARIKVMKGVFNIISSKENGTNIFISVPIKFKEQIA